MVISPVINYGSLPVPILAWQEFSPGASGEGRTKYGLLWSGGPDVTGIAMRQ